MMLSENYPWEFKSSRDDMGALVEESIFICLL